MNFKVFFIKDQQDINKAYEIRRKVFIEEQKVPEEIELDEYDTHVNTRHVLLLTKDGQAVGTARFRPYREGMLKIERVAVLPLTRGGGAGRILLEAIAQEAQKAGYQSIKLGAQLHAKGFYERLGYQAQGEIYQEAGIEHIDMIKNL